MVWQQLLKLKTIPPAILVLFSNTNVLPSSSALSISPFIALVFVWGLSKKVMNRTQQILSNNRYCLINKPSSQLKEQTCMDLLPSWEQMKDGGWMAWNRYDGKRGKERGRQEEETSEWTAGGDADGESMSSADRDAEKQGGLQHSGLKSALVKHCEIHNTTMQKALKTVKLIFFQHLLNALLYDSLLVTV